uniref:Uncharacterized protein n=1 Tax=Coccidioides posadasii RMSCC 3488 TaxID=454284 RepID=A0A0J6FS56_COCPO|nr:hypothetical protein CPAG_08557 [Coccidioides posadasii RMSCC 3488]
MPRLRLFARFAAFGYLDKQLNNSSSMDRTLGIGAKVRVVWTFLCREDSSSQSNQHAPLDAQATSTEIWKNKWPDPGVKQKGASPAPQRPQINPHACLSSNHSVRLRKLVDVLGDSSSHTTMGHSKANASPGADISPAANLKEPDLEEYFEKAEDVEIVTETVE